MSTAALLLSLTETSLAHHSQHMCNRDILCMHVFTAVSPEPMSTVSATTGSICLFTTTATTTFSFNHTNVLLLSCTTTMATELSWCPGGRRAYRWCPGENPSTSTSSSMEFLMAQFQSHRLATTTTTKTPIHQPPPQETQGKPHLALSSKHIRELAYSRTHGVLVAVDAYAVEVYRVKPRQPVTADRPREKKSRTCTNDVTLVEDVCLMETYCLTFSSMTMSITGSAVLLDRFGKLQCHVLPDYKVQTAIRRQLTPRLNQWRTQRIFPYNIDSSSSSNTRDGDDDVVIGGDDPVAIASAYDESTWAMVGGALYQYQWKAETRVCFKLRGFAKPLCIAVLPVHAPVFRAIQSFMPLDISCIVALWVVDATKQKEVVVVNSNGPVIRCQFEPDMVVSCSSTLNTCKSMAIDDTTGDMYFACRSYILRARPLRFDIIVPWLRTRLSGSKEVEDIVSLCVEFLGFEYQVQANPVAVGEWYQGITVDSVNRRVFASDSRGIWVIDVSMP